MSIAENIAQIRQRMAAAALRAGRQPGEIALMAVSKTLPADRIREAFEAGQRLFGENRVQEFQSKHAELSAAVNGEAVHVVAAPDAAQFLLNISANGKNSTTRLTAHAAAVFLPDFDPGAWETLLMLAAKQNNRDLWAILPKDAGSIEAVQLATYADQQGTLDGKTVTVHHLVATIAGAKTDLFSGPENQLLQAELPQQGFALVRKGFVLTPSAKPIAPAEN